MIKLFHIVAIGALISSALYAYSIKYDTLYHSEELQKLKARALKEREAIAVLRAEWQHLNRPERLQVLADRHLQLERMQITQIVRFQDVPMRGEQQDTIGRKLEMLGLSDQTPTASLARPTQARPATAVTPRPRSVTVAGAHPPDRAGTAALTPRPGVAARPAAATAPRAASAIATVPPRPAPQSVASAGRPLAINPPSLPPRPIPQPVRP